MANPGRSRRPLATSKSFAKLLMIHESNMASVSADGRQLIVNIPQVRAFELFPKQ